MVWIRIMVMVRKVKTKPAPCIAGEHCRLKSDTFLDVVKLESKKANVLWHFWLSWWTQTAQNNANSGNSFSLLDSTVGHCLSVTALHPQYSGPDTDSLSIWLQWDEQACLLEKLMLNKCQNLCKPDGALALQTRDKQSGSRLSALAILTKCAPGLYQYIYSLNGKLWYLMCFSICVLLKL